MNPKSNLCKMFVTKYAMSDGIQELEGEWDEKDPEFFRVASGYFTQYFHGEGREFHKTRESAVKVANAMKSKRIKSLEKSLAAAKSMTFE